LRDSRYNYTGY